jgi:predicted RNA-binding protein with RPS1 domain
LGIGADAKDDVAYLASREQPTGAPDLYSWNPNSRVDETPVLYKIYRGRVSKLMDFGAFVQLEGLATPMEGLVHRDAMCATAGRADVGGSSAVSALVKPRDVVFVKVLGASKARISLSMVEADQLSGKDKNPGRAHRAAALARGQDERARANPAAPRRDWAKELGIYVPPDETIEAAKGRAPKVCVVVM